jgi:voltage-gated potassium channel
MIWSFITSIFQEPASKSFKIFHDSLAVIILISTLLVVFETVPSVALQYVKFFWYADVVIVAFFGIEYLLRFFTDKNPLQYMFSAMGIIDLVAILPSIVLFSIPGASASLRVLQVIRSVRILRLFRAMRLVRFFKGTTQGAVRVNRAEKLLPFENLEIYFFALFIVITFSASLMYLVESHIPGSAFRTIPDGMWWAMTTVTTVGYGDMVPMTVIGKIIASITMLSGFVLLALLLSVVGPALQVILFGEKLEEKKDTAKVLVRKPRKPRVIKKEK